MFAQALRNAGTIEGTVTDPSGASRWPYFTSGRAVSVQWNGVPGLMDT